MSGDGAKGNRTIASHGGASLTGAEPRASRRCPTCGRACDASMAFCPTDGSRLEEALAEAAPGPGLVGKVLADRYRILRKLGEGGMGEVFEAQHVYIDKRFAIKTLRADVTQSEGAVERFHQEARAASTIGHENIVEVDDFGRLPDGSVYLAMEFLDGCSLAERLREPPPLGRDEALDYVIQACRGLAAAHQKGIVHRDVKPDNVFLARKPNPSGGPPITRVKVLDFGIAKVTGPDASAQRLTQTGAVFGTPFYMSPEQALGKTQDARSDVYSVGVILYELFAGRLPFSADTFMAILSQHITARPTPPHEVAPERDIPPPLEALILRALAKEPQDRFPSMSALADALEEVRRSADADTAPPDRARAGRRPAERATSPLALEAEASSDEPLALAPREAIGGDPGDARRSTAKPGARAAWAVFAIGALALTTVALVSLRGARHHETVARPEPATTAPAATAPATPSAIGQSPVETRLVHVESTPAGARVLDGERVLGTTPVDVPVPVDRPLHVVLHHEGYVSRALTLDTRLPRIAVPLERAHHETRPVRHPGDPGYEALPPPPIRGPRAREPAPLDPY